ncbi:protein adenylyltransferase SelO [Mobilicoccus caccae]|uniref:Protein nucleotidyltransferase YdiU n=1 Tax=Mobilicoccus caccae TaxID=1859295 RepID=A0ABQ6IY99_9MICO|nr:YdiU family protein [Mobilicoccus caccae]GMA42046.1 UPF0061 protein [Mobilicoccus caccae]
MSPAPSLQQTYVEALPDLSMPWRAASVEQPRLVAFDADLAAELGLDSEWLRGAEGVRMLAGQVDERVPTYAQAYAGHQFGSYSPVLGDGRALLLGEYVDPSGRRHDLHLKGSGRTPFARGGDGYAVIGPMLREYLMGQAMHGLGIPTTRALAVVATGREVRRERPLPGAILCRVADSHLRVGTFQYAASLRRFDVLEALADHAIDRHHPSAREHDNPYLALFDEVCRVQAELVAAWMGVGFVHGVMNTDNMTISGQTIDYGPCAFIDAHDPRAVFSSIDHQGRYAYGNQPGIAQWNLARLGEALLPLIAGAEPGEDADKAVVDDAVAAATAVLEAYAGRYEEAFLRLMGAKLGLPSDAETGRVRSLATDLFALMTREKVDHTLFFRALTDGTTHALVDVPEFDDWSQRRAALLGPEEETARAAMRAVNPVYIPRNHLVEEALAAATEGDLAPFERLVDAVRRPYEPRPGLEDFTHPAPPDAAPHVTYCGT